VKAAIATEAHVFGERLALPATQAALRAIIERRKSG
jgi:hypothetical protein